MASLRDLDDLRKYVVENVRQTEEDRVLGTGSYGTVEEVYTTMQLSSICNNYIILHIMTISCSVR